MGSELCVLLIQKLSGLPCKNVLVVHYIRSLYSKGGLFKSEIDIRSHMRVLKQG